MPTDTDRREITLTSIRDEARELAAPPAQGPPVPPSETGYYGLPLLKRPVWSASVPLYFFVGGAAGAAAIIGAAARARGRNRLAHDARWMAAGGALISAALLTEDLGRPSRFLNMLRVFKPQSAMSVGSWALSAFGASATGAALTSSAALDVAAAATGAVMTTYTGVLIGATAIPAWSEAVDLLPAHFGASALGSATALLELLGHRDAALHHLATVAAAAETVAGASVEMKRSAAVRPLKEGPSGLLVRVGGLLSGPMPLALRLLGRRRRMARRAAGLSAIIGSLVTRFGWVRAGSASADDPAVPLKLPRA
jgi:hypothetical protein